VGLSENHLWIAGARGRRGSVPNLPTEGIFTAPHLGHVDGVVRATKPLSYLGTTIDGLKLRFEDGAVVEARAEVGQSSLGQLLGTDDGAVRLGGVALAPQSSLVAADDLVWRNALINENDACHIALGRAYPVCVEGGPAMSAEERLAAGLNASDIRVGFVIGSAGLSVMGIAADGQEEPLLVNGEWAFDV